MSELGGLWQHKHTQHAPYATKMTNLMILVAQAKWTCCCGMDIFAVYKIVIIIVIILR